MQVKKEYTELRTVTITFERHDLFALAKTKLPDAVKEFGEFGYGMEMSVDNGYEWNSRTEEDEKKREPSVSITFVRHSTQPERTEQSSDL